MSEKEDTTKPITDQIFEEMISNIQQNPEFNDDLVKKITTLYKDDELKVTKLIDVIKPE